MRPESTDNTTAAFVAELDAALDFDVLPSFDIAFDSRLNSSASDITSAGDNLTRGATDPMHPLAEEEIREILREAESTDAPAGQGVGKIIEYFETFKDSEPRDAAKTAAKSEDGVFEESFEPKALVQEEQGDERSASPPPPYSGDEQPKSQEPLEVSNSARQQYAGESIYLSPWVEPQTSQDSKHHTSGHSRNASNSSVTTISGAPSNHPVSCMQGAFQESIVDSMDPPAPEKLADKLSAEARRRQLLELKSPDDYYSSRWQQKPGAKFHPLWKLVAQICYGVHLLHKNIARSDHQVVTTLQEHVDEIDSFVEDTLADFELAAKDIDDRLRSLLLPLEHSRMFNRMLCESGFRQSIIEGNDIIERIISRTTAAMHSAMRDVTEGEDATRELDKFLKRLGSDWAKHDDDLLAIFNAMRNNAQGWLHCFAELQAKATQLAKLMSRLTYVIDDVAKRCGIASRRKTVRAKSSSNSSTPSTQSLHNLDKPLPAPPMRHKTTSSAPRLTERPTQSPVQTPARPNLVSADSSQTIDCTRPAPTSLESHFDHPTTAKAAKGSTSADAVPFEVSRAASRNIRSVSHQTGMDQFSRRYAPAHTPVPSASMLSRSRTASPLSSPQSSKSLQPTPVQSPNLLPPSLPSSLPPSLPPPTTRSSHSSTTSNQTLKGNNLPSSPQLTGLGIMHSLSQTQLGTLEDDDATHSNLKIKKSATLPCVSHAPSTITPQSSSELSSHSVPKLASLSPFPSTGSLPKSILHRPSIDSRASDKIVVVNTPSNDEDNPSSAIDSAYQSSSAGSPSLSKSNSETHLASAKARSRVPFTPDDITPHGALSSHPITASMYFPSISDPLTALPPVPPSLQGSNLDDITPRMEPSRKSSFVGKKPSMPSMKSIFARKPVKREQYLGSNGLGGFVVV